MNPYAALMQAARDPGKVATLALAGVMSMASQRSAPYGVPIAGLDRNDMRGVLARYFPALDPAPLLEATPVQYAKSASHIDEFHDLIALLSEQASFPGDESRWLAQAIATASMGSNHLWQDMGLPSRQVLSNLMELHFTGLFIRNVGDMKWKKFFYRQLCEKAEVLICKSPSCGACVDYHLCYGTEEIVEPGHFSINHGHAHR